MSYIDKEIALRAIEIAMIGRNIPLQTQAKITQALENVKETEKKTNNKIDAVSREVFDKG